MIARVQNDLKGFVVMIMEDGKALSCLHFDIYFKALNYAIACELSDEVESIEDLAELL
jgi:hypothetical protein